jgi:hypothetical protein
VLVDQAYVDTLFAGKAGQTSSESG